MSSSRPIYLFTCAAIVVLATVLRFLHLGEWSMWIDEGMTYMRAVSGRLDDQGPLYSTAPLNFLLTRQIVLATEPSLFWLRFGPAVAGCLGVAAVLFAGNRIGGRTVSVVAGLLVALSTWHIDWSQNARHYAMVFLCATLSFTCLYDYLRSGRLAWVVGALVASAVGLASHSSISFVIAAQGICALALVVHPRTRASAATLRNVIVVGAYFALIAAAYLPIVIMVSQYLGESKTAWNPPHNVAAGIVYYLGAFELALAGLVGLYGAIAGRREFIVCLCWLAVPVVLAPIAGAFTISSNVYAFSALAPLAILIGLGMRELVDSEEASTRIVGLALIGAIVTGALTRDFLYYTSQDGNRPPWKETAAWLAPRLVEGDVVYSSEGIVLGYHLDEPRYGGWLDAWITRPRDTPTPRQWVAVLGGVEGMWSPSVRARLTDECRLRKVFYRNSGPKRRDVEIYECPAVPPPLPPTESPSPEGGPDAQPTAPATPIETPPQASVDDAERDPPDEL